jgi:hypothetical protein
MYVFGCKTIQMQFTENLLRNLSDVNNTQDNRYTYIQRLVKSML